MYASAENDHMYSNRIVAHAGYSWAEDYQRGNSVVERSTGGTRIVQDKSLREFQDELRAKRFGDSYVKEESRVSRNTNSIYPEYVARQRRVMEEQNRREDLRNQRLQMESAVCAVGAENYRKLVILISALVAALIMCMATLFTHDVLIGNVAAQDVNTEMTDNNIQEEELPEEITLTAIAK